MATETVLVRFREDGAKEVQGKFFQLGGSAQVAAQKVKLLNQALFDVRKAALAIGVLAIANEMKQLIGAFIAASDSITGFRNRLGFLVDGSAEVSAALRDVFNVASQTRTAFGATAELFTRLSLSARELGASEKDVLTVTKSINQAIILSGAGIRESANGLIQLAQGIASNRLAGDELRAVLEQLPAVADVLAQHLGVTRGELRALGREGRITGDVIIEAFVNASTEIRNQFTRTTPTVAQALEVLKTKMFEVVDAINQATGAATTLADALIGLSKINMEEVGKSLLSGGVGGLVGLLFEKAAREDMLRDVRELVDMLTEKPDVQFIELVRGRSGRPELRETATRPGTGPNVPPGIPFDESVKPRDAFEDERRFLQAFGRFLELEKEALETTLELENERNKSIQRMTEALGGGGPASALPLPAPEQLEGAVAGIEPISEELRRMQEVGQEAFGTLLTAAVDTAAGVEDAFVTAIENIASQFSNFLIGEVLNEIFPGFRGGRQHGGPTGRGGRFMVGEGGPEVVTLPANARVDPVQPVAPTVVNVINVTDPDEVSRYIASGKADRAILNRVTRNPQAFGLASPGGF